MTDKRSRRAIAVVLGVAMTLAQSLAPARAIDVETMAGRPELRPVRAKIKAMDWKGAAADLYAMIDRGAQHADVYSLLGFVLRNDGEYRAAYAFYRKALEFDPEHKGALEYLGELYVKTGELAKARENLALLKRLCPQGCEELSDLEKAIAEAPAAAQ